MIWTAFLLGFLGSFHCVGMCGPIALAVSANDRSRYLLNKLAYNVGRTTTYAVLGGVVGLVGFSLSMAGFQQWLSVLLGGLIILMAFFYQKSERWLGSVGMFGGINKLKSSLAAYLRKRGLSAFFVTGLLNGLLPCGMVYVALAASLALQSPLQGAVYMMVFGIGTVPILLALMMSQRVLSVNIRKKMYGLLPYFAMFVGILFIVRGLGLGIHYISPKLAMGTGSQGQTEMTLCE
ncbi:MAG: sulfite exporter TauE/SafE family protein [Lunatimonas sp.]|uniref:sulfite exporter TauE/SafE family protein n=1 Tax=Lunatimonas sp. TaxID=2060141 RepID=UPI00263BE239|nr:sulfite exporter TauE/SafE family protein [Lunatimonas sp.]MCC5939393.1 sulfite exporter TauE/SafE family protein [Lunatimonas sp.]